MSRVGRRTLREWPIRGASLQRGAAGVPGRTEAEGLADLVLGIAMR